MLKVQKLAQNYSLEQLIENMYKSLHTVFGYCASGPKGRVSLSGKLRTFASVENFLVVNIFRNSS